MRVYLGFAIGIIQRTQDCRPKLTSVAAKIALPASIKIKGITPIENAPNHDPWVIPNEYNPTMPLSSITAAPATPRAPSHAVLALTRPMLHWPPSCLVIAPSVPERRWPARPPETEGREDSGA